MERLTARGFGAGLSRPLWEARRAARAFVRRRGVFWPALLACLALAGAGLVAGRDQAVRAALLAASAPAAAPVATAVAPDASDPGQAGARSRLRAFDAHLLPHADIPFALQDLLELGAAEGLSMQRGSYRPQADGAGGFLRYRMTLPVRGPAPAIQRFMKAALQRHRNLALDGVQFKRERVGATEIEARIDWVLLARLPGAPQ